MSDSINKREIRSIRREVSSFALEQAYADRSNALQAFINADRDTMVCKRSAYLAAKIRFHSLSAAEA